MTASEKRKYQYKWTKFQQKYEKYFQSQFTKALQEQVKAYIKTQDLMSVPVFPIYDTLMKLYTIVGPAWAREVRVDAYKANDNLPIGQIGFNERIVELMRRYYGIDLLNDANLMTTYSRQVIMSVLSKAAETGASFDEIVKQLLAHPDFNAMRARRIARTETVTAANGAAIIYAQASGNEMEKIWISVKDKRTRNNQYANHVSIDGTVLPIDQPFKLSSAKYGEVLMMQPGVRRQSNGADVPAAEVVNCRCTVAFRAKRDSRGNILRRY